MSALPTPEDRQRITAVADKHITAMLEKLSSLYPEVPDEGIVAALRDGGYGHEADMYEDWIQDEDPPRKVNAPDPEGPGGYVTDPPSESYAPLIAQLDEQRKATSITYEWTERERMMYSCRATVNRSQLQTWLNAKVDNIVTPEEIDAEIIVEFLEANPGASVDERRWPAEHSETDCFDLKVVQP